MITARSITGIYFISKPEVLRKNIHLEFWNLSCLFAEIIDIYKNLSTKNKTKISANIS